MPISAAILFVLGILGAVDIAVYHSTAHGLRKHPDAKWELALHACRGHVYTFLFLAVPNLLFQGWCFWILIGVLALDLVISIVDFSLERGSREFLGGLPSGAYVLHVLIGILFGSFVTAAFFEGAHLMEQQPGITLVTDEVAPWLRGILGFMACLVFVSGSMDARAACRMHGQAKRMKEAK